jgi:general secretion pathway protein E
MDLSQEKFFQFAVARGAITPAWVDRVGQVLTDSTDSAPGLLVKLGALSEESLANLLSQFLGAPRVAPGPSLRVEEHGINAEFLKAHRALPYRDAEGSLWLAMADPLDGFPPQALEHVLAEPVRLSVATRTQIEAALKSISPEDHAAVSASAQGQRIDDLRDLASEAPVIRAVQRLIAQAYDQRASDIHLEPVETGLRVRIRVDGLLQDMETLGRDFAEPLVSRIKVMAQLNIAERRLPQDGRIRVSVHGRDTDFRVATTPTHHGEGVVLRILDRRDITLDLDALGIHEQALQVLKAGIAQPHGIVLVTGPTGSGKTTTLYSALRTLNTHSRKILTIEDPIEYMLEGINQVQVKPQIGLTFAHALRSFLRQDPDVMMVGEIRDTETATIAIQAAMTGHLVLSTVHTNSAAGAVTRLLDMGIEPFLLASTLNAVMGQRLVRNLCMNCRQPHADVRAALAGWRIEVEQRPEASYYRAVGCATCRGTGYRGRTALTEGLAGQDIRDGILRRQDEATLEKAAVAAGMQTLLRDGLDRAARGVTSIEEVMRVVRET